MVNQTRIDTNNHSFIMAIAGIIDPNERSLGEVSVSAIDLLFSDYRECVDLILIYLSGMMISSGNLRFLKSVSIEDREVKVFCQQLA